MGFFFFFLFFFVVDFLLLPILQFGRWLVRGSITHSLLFVDHVLGKVHWAERCGLCLTWLYGLFVRTLMPLTNAYTGCGRPTLNFIERFDLGRSVPTAKPLHVRAQRTCMHRMSTSLAWVWTWWCSWLIVLSYIVLLFFVLFYATQVKRQKIWLLF